MRKIGVSSTGLVLLAAGAAAFCAGAAGAADHPGQKFSISPASLAKPYATPAVGNESSSIPRPAGAMPEVPQGFQVSIFAENLTGPRLMAVAPNGDIFLAEPPGGYSAKTGGKITVLRD